MPEPVSPATITTWWSRIACDQLVAAFGDRQRLRVADRPGRRQPFERRLTCGALTPTALTLITRIRTALGGGHDGSRVARSIGVPCMISIWRSVRRAGRPLGTARSRHTVAVDADLRSGLVAAAPAEFGRLSDVERERFLVHGERLIRRAHWEGARDVEVSDEMVFTVASHAALLAAGFDERTEPFLNVKPIVLHGRTIITRGRSGRTHVRGRHVRPAVLGRPVGSRSRPGAARLADRAAPGRQPRDGASTSCTTSSPTSSTNSTAPPTACRRLPSRDGAPAWTQTLGTNFRRLRRRGSDGLVRAYGATNPAEYFAVTSELFFTRPTELARRAFHGCTNGSPSSTARTRHDAAEPVRLPWSATAEGVERGTTMSYETGTSDLPPVTDWVNDWDWLDDQWGSNAIEIWNDVREQCPVATTERYGRAHHAGHDGGRHPGVAHDTEHFSSIFVSVARPDAPRRPAPRSRPIRRTITATVDCCCHRSARRGSLRWRTISVSSVAA